MKAKVAMVCRINEIYSCRDIAVDGLVRISDVPSSIIYSKRGEEIKSSAVESVKKLYIVLKINFYTFFDKYVFDGKKVE